MNFAKTASRNSRQLGRTEVQAPVCEESRALPMLGKGYGKNCTSGAACIIADFKGLLIGKSWKQCQDHMGESAEECDAACYLCTLPKSLKQSSSASRASGVPTNDVTPVNM